jgi:hypothetical protein
MAVAIRESSVPDADRLCRRYETLVARRATVDEVTQEIADYVLPRKAIITDRRTEGEELTVRLWTTVGVRANELLAATMAGTLTSSSVRWFSLKVREEALNQDPAVQDWLEVVEDILYLALRQSNFAGETGEVYLDLGAFGTAALFVDEQPKDRPGFNGFLFRALAPGTYVIAENSMGRVDTVIRHFQVSVRAAAEQFGVARLPQDWREAVTREPDKKVEVLHAIYPRAVQNPKRRDALHRPIASVYLAKRERLILDEGGYDNMPVLVPRWSKTTGEVWGRGPGHTALPDLRTLNRAIELTLQAASKAIDPPGLVSSDATFAELDLRPGAQTTVDGDPRVAWVPLQSGTKIDLTQVLKEELKTDIRQVFFWDQLQPLLDRQMTATEVERRLELMRQKLGPTLGRFEAEFLAPLITRCFGLLAAAGAIPAAPPQLQGQELDIEYEGPLARSQKSVRLAGFEQVMLLLQPVTALHPEVLDTFDFDFIARDLAETAGLPPSYRRDPEQVAAIRAQRQQAQTQAMQFEQIARGAEAAGRAAPALEVLQGGTGGGRAA